MRNFHFPFPFSPLSFVGGLAGTLLVTYIALIAVVMSYATLTIEFSQQERSDEASVATLESSYLDALATISKSDYVALGYAKPTRETFVPGAPATALR